MHQSRHCCASYDLVGNAPVYESRYGATPVCREGDEVGVMLGGGIEDALRGLLMHTEPSSGTTMDVCMQCSNTLSSWLVRSRPHDVRRMSI